MSKKLYLIYEAVGNEIESSVSYTLEELEELLKDWMITEGTRIVEVKITKEFEVRKESVSRLVEKGA